MTKIVITIIEIIGYKFQMSNKVKKHSDYNFMRKLSICALVAFIFIGQAIASEKPNIIYILADDLGYGDLGCYGQEIIQTPHIDQLCAEGMKFTNHHSGSTVCAPSRACLMTGQHTGHVTVRGNGKGLELREDKEDITIARVLKNAGYHTAMIGKSGTGADTSVGHSNRKGFDYFYGFNGHGPAHHYFPPLVYRNSEEVHFPNNKKHTGDTYIHDEFMKEIMAYLDRRNADGKPFFLHYAALIPHASLVAPEAWVAKYRGKVGQDVPADKTGGYAPCNEPKATFAGMVSRLDWEVGEIMKKLDELALTKNTLIMFSSDNGPHQAGGNKAEWFNSAGGLRGIKRDLFEGGIRVPMIARWPGKIQAGSETNHLSAFWDVMPTLCAISGVQPPIGIDGINFLPTFLGYKTQQKQHEYLYWAHYEGQGKRAALTQKWKAVQEGMFKEKRGSIMLFDIKADLSEQNDLAAQHPEIIERFEAIFEEADRPSSLYNWDQPPPKSKKRKKKEP
ncbi:MAG: arylsulfatase [Verrucomicrobiota bacterium]